MTIYPLPDAFRRRLNSLTAIAAIGSFTGIGFFLVLLAVTDTSSVLTAGAVIAIVISAVSVAVILAVVVLRLALVLGAWRHRYPDDADINREVRRFNGQQ